MNLEEILEATHDRRRFLNLTLGGGIGMLAGYPTGALATEIAPKTDNACTHKNVLLTDQVREFYLKSIDTTRPEPTWEQADNHWKQAETLFNSMVELETRKFNVTYSYRDSDLDLGSVQLSEVRIDLKEFETEEDKVRRAIESNSAEDISPTINYMDQR